MMSRRKFLRVMAGAGVGGATVKLWTSDTSFPCSCRVRSVRIPAPAGWSGKTALFITDVHYGYLFDPADAVVLNAMARRHRPDVVFMGGDLAHTPATNLA
ncbi:MAG TPA: hypothetical protein VMI53_09190, partial [Opitutaceae bacterium]|nr:hypothetical protein [Opitutaceae bacterium]